MNFGLGLGNSIFGNDTKPAVDFGASGSTGFGFGAGAYGAERRRQDSFTDQILGSQYGGNDSFTQSILGGATNSQQKWEKQAQTPTPVVSATSNTPRAARFIGSTIDARAPQSSADTTPSGRARLGMAPMSDSEWGAQFSGPIAGVATPRAPGQGVSGVANSWDANYPKANQPLGAFPSRVLGMQAQSRFDTQNPSGTAVVPDGNGGREVWRSANGAQSAVLQGYSRMAAPATSTEAHAQNIQKFSDFVNSIFG